MYDSTGFEIKDNGKVFMMLPYRDFIYGNEIQIRKTGIPEPPLKIALLYVLDQTPAHPKMPGDIQHGHAPGQIQYVAFKRSGIGPSLICKPDVNLPDNPALLTFYTLNRQFNYYRLAPYRHAPEPSNKRPPLLDIIRTATRAHHVASVLLHPEYHLAPFVLAMNISIPNYSKPVIQ